MADSQVNRLPFGLLSLIDSQNFGRNPIAMGDTVVPTLDLYTFFTQDQQRVASSTANTIVTASVVSIVVPANEIWDIVAMSARGALPADATATIRYGISLVTKRNTTGQATVFLATGPETQPVYDAISTGRQAMCVYSPPQRLFAYPGDLFSAEAIDVEAGGLATLNTTFNVMYRRLLIA